MNGIVRDRMWTCGGNPNIASEGRRFNEATGRIRRTV